MTTRPSRPYLLVGTGIAAVALVATACGDADSSEAANGDKLSVVAATNVWGSVASAVGGEQVQVESLIADPAADPHSYEASPADTAKVAEAQLVVYNGGGYDDFVGKLADQADNPPRVIAFDLSDKAESGAHGDEHEGDDHGGGDDHAGHGHDEHGHDEHGHDEHGHGGHDHDHGQVNEHVWYDLPTVQRVADQLAKEFGELRPAAKNEFTRNAERFRAEVDDVIGQVEDIRAARSGAEVLATEPASQYLIEAAGLTDATPDKYVEAMENETDVPAATVAEVNKLVEDGDLAAVLNNTQTETPVTSDVLDKAEAANIPVVDVTETLPENADGYVGWMNKQVSALAGALDVR
ncbi:zinc/manganese transport system substrate-binding protein [Tamaricihabitans halophyticus]|uniref:Zinc/manganese transport system substrate-binding protein n=1 Tax=Tamaricihabitans halophyticus TaxID=1262583 RepID=A0A4R2R4R0_9PSEU|nr:zinc ABC transporter substrate-binding protein [Tamaricihabitans halophyticus]TCP56698.1 zinc/manganese transport system substrate-binding protein [Tamaricihabitans halophyticus]